MIGWRNNYNNERYIYSLVDWGGSIYGSIFWSFILCFSNAMFHVILLALKKWIIKQWTQKSETNVQKNIEMTETYIN